MEWMQNLFWKYLLCFLIASVFFSLVRFFSFATQPKRKEMNVRKKTNYASLSILVRKNAPYLLTSFVSLVRVPIYKLIWIFKIYTFSWRHFSGFATAQPKKKANPLSWIIGSSKFFTPLWFVSQNPRRRTFSRDVLGSTSSHTAHLPNSASWICFVLVAVVDFTSLSSTSHSLTQFRFAH